MWMVRGKTTQIRTPTLDFAMNLSVAFPQKTKSPNMLYVLLLVEIW